jgi:hypothetical protein
VLLCRHRHRDGLPLRRGLCDLLREELEAGPLLRGEVLPQPALEGDEVLTEEAIIPANAGVPAGAERLFRGHEV